MIAWPLGPRPPPVYARSESGPFVFAMIGWDSNSLGTLNPSVKTIVGYCLLIGGLLLGVFMRGITNQRFRDAPRSRITSTGQTYAVTIGRRSSQRTVYVTSQESYDADRRQAWSILSLIPILVGGLLIYTEEQAKKETQERLAKERSTNI